MSFGFKCGAVVIGASLLGVGVLQRGGSSLSSVRVLQWWSAKSCGCVFCCGGLLRSD